jgi:predicted lipid-binding transport protein (Tim44 family)
MRKLAVAALVVGLTSFVFDSPTDARPGGGQSYRSSSRSSSSSSSYRSSYRSSSPSRSSGSSTTYRSSSPTIVVPVGGTTYRASTSGSSSSGCSSGGWIAGMVFLALVIGFVIFVATRKNTARAKITVDEGLKAKGIAALRSRDAGFDPAAFAERTRATMGKVNEAWLGGDMGPARRLISDGVYIRFQIQLGLIKLDGLRNAMADWKIVSAEILAAEADDLWDTVQVKVVGEARDADVPLNLDAAAAERKVRSAPLSQYHEVWSFIRRRGQQSKQGVPALEGRCPGCGADMPISDAVRCEYCKAIVNSGEHDWVLAEITQPEEWSPEIAEWDVDGLAELRQRDATVSRQELEDRASVIFWKWIEARATGKAAKLARFCMQPPQLGDGNYILTQAKLQQVAVGSSEVAHIVCGVAGGIDQVLIEIRWSAGVDGAEPKNMLHMFTLARSFEATSKRRLASLDCTNCGGPLAGSDAATCDYCGETLSGGKHEWVLAGVQEFAQSDDSEDE